jgi:hypothetical protein
MPVTEQWLPVEDSFDLELVERLARDGRGFVKGLRYNLRPGDKMARAVLNDVAEASVPLYIGPPGSHQDHDDTSGLAGVSLHTGVSADSWVWHVARGAMPPLPKRGRSAVSAQEPATVTGLAPSIFVPYRHES